VTPVDLLKRMYAAAAAEGPLAIVPFLHEDIEWEQFDVERVLHRGRDAVVAARRGWWENWERYTVEPESFSALDGEQVLVITREYGVARHSGVRVEDRYFNLFTVVDGQVIRFREYRDEAQARDAAGAGASPSGSGA
jgi:ketosteroid isomerase-like protein